MKNKVKILDKEFEPFIGAGDIDQKVQDLAGLINREYHNKELVILGILNGAFCFASAIVRKLEIDCMISFIKVASYEGISSTGKMKKLLGLDIELQGKDVLVIDDIIDSGLTMKYVVSLLEAERPASLKIASLLIKNTGLEKDLPIHYVGFKIPDKFVVGFGLDYKGHGRQLKNIYRLI